MEDKEAVQMIQRCIEELQTQRNVINRLQPQAEAYEVIRDVVRMTPKPSQGMGEDLIWQLRRKIEDLQPKPKAGE